MFKLDFNASSIESWADRIDGWVDDAAPLLAPVEPELAAAVPIVDALDKLIDTVCASPLVTPAIASQMSAAKAQLHNAVNATPAQPAS